MMEEPWTLYKDYLLSKLERLKKYKDSGKVVLVIDNDEKFLELARMASFKTYLIKNNNDWNMEDIIECI